MISLADPTSLAWRQVNTATNGDFTITKTYIADPSRSVVLIQTTFDNLSSTPLQLYADYLPQLDNDGMGNTGGTDAASGDLVASNGSVASALAASAGFTQTTTGYVGSSSDGSTQLASSHALTSTYSSAPTAGHLVQVAQIPVAASGSTTFTLALGFDASQSAAVSDAAASLAAGFSSLESSFESGWHSWIGGLNAPPASVTGSAPLEEQYYVSLMEVKADEDKTYTGGFIAAPTNPWGTSVSANSGGDHGYHVVWTRDEYEMASALLAAGDATDANAALQYIFSYEEESSGAVKQNSFLNGNAVFGSLQMDEVADPIILAWQLGATNAADWGHIESLANYLVSNGPTTPQERWEENGGYSPATMAAEIAGLICAASIAETNGATSQAATYRSTALSWAAEVDSRDVHHLGLVRQRRLLPADHPGREPELRVLDRHRQRRRQPRRPYRGGSQLPGTGPARDQGGHRDRHHQHAARGGRRAQGDHARGAGLAPLQLRRLRRDILRRRLHRLRHRQPVAGADRRAR